MSSIASRLDTESAFYPLFLNLAGKLCVVVGGGAVAQRKVRMLLSFGARVRVVAPRVTRFIAKLAEEGGIELSLKPFADNDLSGAELVFAATDENRINRSVNEEARRMGVPVNVADAPDLCDFYVPSVIRKGPIVIAISTSGLLPSLSKKLRLALQGLITRDYERYLRKVSRFRAALLRIEPDRKRRMHIMRELAKLPLEDVLKMAPKDLERRLVRQR